MRVPHAEGCRCAPCRAAEALRETRAVRRLAREHAERMATALAEEAAGRAEAVSEAGPGLRVARRDLKPENLRREAS